MILFATIAVRKEFWFFKTPQVKILFLLAAAIFLNWVILGRADPPAYLSALDDSTRALERSINQFAFLLLFVAFVRTPRQLLLLNILFLASILLTAPGAIAHSLGGVGRAMATGGIQAAENANRLAFLSLMGISLIWFAILEYRMKLLRIVGALLIPILVLTVFLSGSRSGVLNLALLPMLLLAQSGLRRGQIAAVLLVLVLSIGVSLVLVPQQILERISSFSLTSEIAGQSGATLSAQRRVTLLQAGFKMVRENPFMGVGVGNFRWVSALDPSYGGASGATHNAYLLALAEGGIILLGIYLWLFWRTLKDLGRALKQSALASQLQVRWLVLATRTNLILLLVFSVFAEAWKEFYFLLILVTAAVLCRLYQKATEQSWTRSPSST